MALEDGESILYKMDPLTQASLGAAVAVAFSSRQQARWAILVGCVAGAAPDLDVLIRSASDPLLSLHYHRHFTHALFSAPLLGLCVAGLFKLLCFRSTVTFQQFALYAVLGALTHGLLDACTSYGTMLYWPFSQHRESWDLISVIDPIFSLPLVLLTLFAFAWRRPRFAQLALVFCALYFGFCGLQRSRATHSAELLAAERGHHPEQYSIRPSFGNSMLWRIIYRTEGRYYVDAVQIAPGVKPRLYEGQSVEAFTQEHAAACVPPESVLGRDIERFRFFSQGFLYLHPNDQQVIGDVRYAMWPDSVVPLWGIRINPVLADQHTKLVYYRDPSKPARDRLWQMIQGREVAVLNVED
jgi:inner membrane protein